jgi:hypothetical protein
MLVWGPTSRDLVIEEMAPETARPSLPLSWAMNFDTENNVSSVDILHFETLKDWLMTVNRI